uniref:Uncharacterized protein n=1 Tax=Vespula pensylvanica TaxID=30213 RepID=A0A834UD18_VESPE|nr:hypothetical protein H0235_004778 [Vespula pensylvanica]
MAQNRITGGKDEDDDDDDDDDDDVDDDDEKWCVCLNEFVEICREQNFAGYQGSEQVVSTEHGLPPAISFPDANDADGDGGDGGGGSSGSGGGSSGIGGSMPLVFSHPRDDPCIFRGHARTIESSR